MWAVHLESVFIYKHKKIKICLNVEAHIIEMACRSPAGKKGRNVFFQSAFNEENVQCSGSLFLLFGCSTCQLPDNKADWAAARMKKAER